MQQLLSINSINCQYDNADILKSLSLDVEAGEIICLLGASGMWENNTIESNCWHTAIELRDYVFEGASG